MHFLVMSTPHLFTIPQTFPAGNNQLKEGGREWVNENAVFLTTVAVNLGVFGTGEIMHSKCKNGIS
jgi:hypothetical protein